MIKVITIEDRLIAIGGIGKMYYETGFPISMAIDELNKRGIEVSLFHVADECLKNGWSPKTTISRIQADFDEDINKSNNKYKITMEQIIEFCMSDYESQRQIIFDYLFSSEQQAKNFILNNNKMEKQTNRWAVVELQTRSNSRMIMEEEIIIGNDFESKDSALDFCEKYAKWKGIYLHKLAFYSQEEAPECFFEEIISKKF